MIPFRFLSLVSPLVLIRESQLDLIPAVGVSPVSRLYHFLYSARILYNGSQTNHFGLILLKSVLSLRKTMPKNAQTTTQLHSSHTLVLGSFLKELNTIHQFVVFLQKIALAFWQLYLRQIFILLVQLKENQLEPIFLCLFQNMS